MVVGVDGLVKSQATLVAVAAPVREPAPQAVSARETESRLDGQQSGADGR